MPYKNVTLTGSSTQNPTQKKLHIVTFGNWTLTQATKFKSFFCGFYDTVILAAVMITYLTLVFFILDQTCFENDQVLI